MKVAIIYGGRSGEHEISLISATAIARNINATHDVVLIGITKDGRWFLQDKKLLEKIRSDKNATLSITEDESKNIFVIPGGGKNFLTTKSETLSVDVVFPVLHGTYGEDGTVQGLFDMAGAAYVGCGVTASAVTMDKEITKRLWIEAGLPVVPYLCMTRSVVNDSASYDALFQKAIDTLGFPLFVKPCSAGSSDGANKATNAKELSVALMDAFQWDDKVLIEKAINALEVECSVVGNSVTAASYNEREKVRVFGPGAIAPTHTFYDYDAKYNDPDGAALQIPALIPADVAEKIRKLAVAAYKAVSSTGLSRVDFFLDKDSGDIYLNEQNAMPGFTQISMFPKLCEHEGIGFSELIDLLLEEAVALFNTKASLKTSR